MEKLDIIKKFVVEKSKNTLLQEYDDDTLHKYFKEEMEISMLRFVSNMSKLVQLVEKQFLSLKLELHFTCFCYLIDKAQQLSTQ